MRPYQPWHDCVLLLIGPCTAKTHALHTLGTKRLLPRPMTALRYSHIGLLSNASIAVHQSLQGESLVQQVEAKIVLLAGRPN